MKIYKTKQKNFVLECLKKHENENLTSENIIGFLKQEGVSVSNATVYRHLNSLLEDKSVRRIMGSDGVFVYRYFDKTKNCERHSHLVCDSCGKLIHLECESLDKIYEHIKNEHGFSVDGIKTVFYGKCKDCRKKSEKN